MSPKTPRNVSGQQLVKVLIKYNYRVLRQKGSHIRMTNDFGITTHHITIPNHTPIKLGTLNSIMQDVCAYLEIPKDELYNIL